MKKATIFFIFFSILNFCGCGSYCDIPTQNTEVIIQLFDKDSREKISVPELENLTILFQSDIPNLNLRRGYYQRVDFFNIPCIDNGNVVIAIGGQKTISFNVKFDNSSNYQGDKCSCYVVDLIEIEFVEGTEVVYNSNGNIYEVYI